MRPWQETDKVKGTIIATKLPDHEWCVLESQEDQIIAELSGYATWVFIGYDTSLDPFQPLNHEALVIRWGGIGNG